MGKGKPKALDLFCSAGGASVGLHRAGFDVVGVDIAEQPRYPFEFHRLDAMSLGPDFLFPFDLIWASPPCQLTRKTGNSDEHPDYIENLRETLRATGIRHVIENVPGAPLENPIQLCGAMFDLGVIRHRLFECSWDIERPKHVKHKGSLVTGEYVAVTGNGGVPARTLKEREKRGLPRHRPGEYSLENWSRAMGIDWMNRKELVEAIPPAYAEWIGRRALLIRPRKYRRKGI